MLKTISKNEIPESQISNFQIVSKVVALVEKKAEELEKNN